MARHAFCPRWVVEHVRTTIRQCAAKYDFALLAYCFMPDHVHLIVAATTESANLRKFVSMSKQLTGYAHKRATGEFLWQPSYYDHILRDDHETARAIRYVLENPVRQGLVRHVSGLKGLRYSAE